MNQDHQAQRGVPLSQDMREWVSRRVGGLAWSGPGAGV
ncbi:MAG: hypothetical protein QOI89_3678, partial [Solirubrobacteraceae bacterium]|nr:hypothetical protein [Solirubrobacteraceae bacterium]